MFFWPTAAHADTIDDLNAALDQGAAAINGAVGQVQDRTGVRLAPVAAPHIERPQLAAPLSSADTAATPPNPLILPPAPAPHLIPDLGQLPQLPLPVLPAGRGVPAAPAAPGQLPTKPNSPVPVGNGPNHEWVNDPLSQLLAGRPGPVLHRVDGSWFDAPDAPPEAYDPALGNSNLMGPSTPLFVGDNKLCTLTVAGYDEAGRKVGFTAAHCGEVGDRVYSADSWGRGPAGTVAYSQPAKGFDVIEFSPETTVSRSYNGVTVNALGQSGAEGTQVWKQGVGTGRTGGITLTSSNRSIVAHLCSMHGDSGAPVMVGDSLVGMIQGGVFNNAPCTTPLQGPLHTPVIFSQIAPIMEDIDLNAQVGAGFRLPPS